MTRKAPPALRSSPSFHGPSYGAVTDQQPSGASTPASVAATSSTSTEPTQAPPETAEAPLRRTSTNATGVSAVSSRQVPLRRKRSRAASFAQYDALTGGSSRVPPPELEAEALLTGLGGTRFDAAGTAAAAAAVPSEASYDSDSEDDDRLDSLSEACYDGEERAVSDTDHSMRLDGDGCGNGQEEGYGEGRGGPGGGRGKNASRDPLGDDIDGDAASSHPPDNSTFAQVRASVAPVDNIFLSVTTPRMWFLSTLFSILGSSTNLLFSLRYPSVAITPVIALLLVHPLGRAWDFVLKRADDPPGEFVNGGLVHSPGQPTVRRQRSWLRRLRLWLSQGSWNEKEHACVYVSSNVSFGFAFATDVIVEQTHFYKQDISIVYQLLLIVSTQILGYAFAGLARRFLVRPSGMIWPSTLMSAAMFSTLHKEENKPAGHWRISRWRFFYAVFLGAFAFYFIPGLLMPALSYFNVVTWFAPKNVIVSNLFGVVSGLGLFPMTFDWAQVAYIGSPLLTPFWAAMNVVGGLVVVMWIVAPIAYYSNWLYSSFMPILSASVFDNTGQVYDVSRILTPEFTFDRAAYRSYSRVFLPITYVLSYGVQFAGLASLLTHTACWHGRDIWRQWTRSLEEARALKAAGKRAESRMGHPRRDNSAYQPIPSSPQDTLDEDAPDIDRPSAANPNRHRRGSGLLGHEDVHCRLMKRYEDAPMWWYLATFVSMTAVGMFLVE